jgi:hypothetical protein
VNRIFAMSFDVAPDCRLKVGTRSGGRDDPMEWPATLGEEELERWRRHALDLHDEVVQGLAMAKLSLELGESEAGMAAIEQTLAAARSLVSDLLGEPGVVDLRNGALRRSTPAGP